MEGKNDLRVEELEGYAEGPGWAEIRGLGPEPRYARHEYLNALLKAAVNTIPESQEGPFEIQTLVYVKHSSPGWWDGFRVNLQGGG